jgi:hypothetical protein
MSTYVPYLNTEELKVLFDYKSARCVVTALHTGALPLPYYKVKNRIVVDREVIRLYFAKMREAGKTKIGNLKF